MCVEGPTSRPVALAGSCLASIQSRPVVGANPPGVGQEADSLLLLRIAWRLVLVGLALIAGIGVGCLLQAVLFQVAVRAKGEILTTARAAALSLVVLMGGFFVASPIIELREQRLAYILCRLSAMAIPTC